MSKLSIFNPDHEIALANNDKNFKPKKNIVRLAHDLLLLPLWYDSGCTIYVSAATPQWESLACSLGLNYNKVESIDYGTITELNLWGWNIAICSSLANKGIPERLLKTEAELATVRRLTQRQTAIEAMRQIKRVIYSPLLPDMPQTLTSISELEVFVRLFGDVVLKSPLSESGKGVYFASANTMNHSILGWVKRTISQQGYIVAERRYEVRYNFAMEFAVSGEKVYFDGYSLFTTNGKSYEKNILIPDTAIEQLIAKYVPIELIENVRNVLISFIKSNISPYYKGYLGVDMFIYYHKNEYRLHPCVEINLRPTMGLVANRFFKNYVTEGRQGTFSVDFYKNPNELANDHQCRQKVSPIEVVNGRLTRGYVSLCPIMSDTQYRVRVEIE